MVALHDREVKTFDIQLESMLEWANTRSTEAEQLALDCTRLLSCTEDRLGQIKGQGFFKRCWHRLSGKTGGMERANTSDLIHMQKASLRFIYLLQERQLMMAHSMLTLKNNLVTLAVKEEETRNILTLLAENTLRRFSELGDRIDQVEISSNLQGWVLTLEDRGYEDVYPTPYLRMFRIINDFYGYKNDNWNFNDLLFMRKALRTVGIDPKKQISMKEFIENIVDENMLHGFDAYSSLVMACAPSTSDDFGRFVLDNISSQVFTAVHGLHAQYTDRFDIIEELSADLNISKDAALKRVLKRYIAKLNVDLDRSLPIADIAIEMLSGLRLSHLLCDSFVQNTTKSDEQCAEFLEMKPQSSVEQVSDNGGLTDGQRLSLLNVDSLNWDKSKLFIVDDRLGERFRRHGGSVSDVVKFKEKYIVVAESGVGGYSYFSTLDFKCFESVDVDQVFNLIVCNGVLFGLKREGREVFLYCSFDCTDWRKLDVNLNCGGESVELRNVFYVNGQYCVACSFRSRYSFKKKGMIFDSDENTYATSALLYFSTDLAAWSCYSFEKDFPKYNILSIDAGNDALFFLGQKDRSPDHKILASSRDGFKWTEIGQKFINSRLERFSSFDNKYCLFADKVLYKTTDFDHFKIFDVNPFNQSYIPREFAATDYKQSGVCSNMVAFIDRDSLVLTQDFVDYVNVLVPDGTFSEDCWSSRLFVIDKGIVLANNLEIIYFDI